MHKKGYFLSIDAFIAVGIVFLGLAIFLSQYSFKPPEYQTFYYSTDVMDTLYSSHIYDLNEDIYPYLKAYKANGSIERFDITVLEQLATFVYIYDTQNSDKHLEMAKNLTKEIINSSVSNRFYYNITLKWDTKSFSLFNKTIDRLGRTTSAENSSMVIPSRRLVSSVVSGNDVELMVAEVLVWQ